MMGPIISFKRVIWKIIPTLSLLPPYTWNTGVSRKEIQVFSVGVTGVNFIKCSGLPCITVGTSSSMELF